MNSLYIKGYFLWQKSFLGEANFTSCSRRYSNVLSTLEIEYSQESNPTKPRTTCGRHFWNGYNLWLSMSFTTIIYLFKVNNKKITWKRCEICSELTTKALILRHWRCSEVFIFNLIFKIYFKEYARMATSVFTGWDILLRNNSFRPSQKLPRALPFTARREFLDTILLFTILIGPTW